MALLIMLAPGCKEDSKTTPALETGTVTDIDNNVYKTVKIGNQWWMAENLKVKKYRNGNLIPQSQASTDWVNITPAYCLYDNNAAAPGLLYNWYAVTDTNNLAPAGWHIPTDEEWKTLEMSLGMSQAEADKFSWRGINEGEKLKIEAPLGWTRYGDVWAKNESGFTALAGGCRLFNGVWADPGLFATGFWWAATEHNDNESYYRYLDYKNADVFRSHVSKNYGMSIRCVKD
ncbi:MAG: fibrobacter succinogenes major paralogous domain-containing protein [Bacteroidia bacterium]